MKTKRWVVAAPEREQVDTLMQDGYAPLTAAVLAARGIGTARAAASYLSSDRAGLYDPFLLTDMDKAVAAIRGAMARGERIVVYGDYDVDGITATCTLVDYLRSKGADCAYYIPNRLREGYGLTRTAMEQLYEEGTRLLITVDSGITADEEIAAARDLGIQVVITDHHECHDSLPAADAVVDCKRPDCSYPFASLAGVGVAFKLICALEGDTDAMLDRYWFGDADRVSPEAPVPVVRISRTEERLGGAANVAVNIASVGASSSLLCVVGNDEPGHTLERFAREAGITPHLQFDNSLATTVKLRIVARQQQMLRCDFEALPAQEVLNQHLDRFRSLLAQHDVLVLSDYGKGGLSHIVRMIEMANEAGIPILVDPKGDDYARYTGATILTPNRSELRQVVGAWNSEEELTAKAQGLRESLGLRYLLLTRSEEGMTLYHEGGQLTVPTQAREVYDVSGAGDTVIAILATMLATGANIEEAVRTANRAGGIVVGKLGTATVSFEELFKD